MSPTVPRRTSSTTARRTCSAATHRRAVHRWPLNDRVHYTPFDASGATACRQVTIGGWEDSLLRRNVPVARRAIAWRTTSPFFRVGQSRRRHNAEQRRHLQRDESPARHRARRPARSPGSGAGIAAGFESDRWSRPRAATPATTAAPRPVPCQTVAWAIAEPCMTPSTSAPAPYAIYAAQCHDAGPRWSATPASR